MNILLTKLAAFVIYPMGVITILVGLAIFMRLLGRVRTSRVLVVLSLLILVVCSVPQSAKLVASLLEDRYPPVAIAQLPSSDVAVVLGGLLAPPLKPRNQVELVDSSDRLLHAFRIYRQGKVKHVYLSGGNVFDGIVSDSESVYAQSLLEEWGVPGNRIRTDTGSRTTYQNAIETRNYLSKNGWINKPVLLITSALHMPRAVETFRAAGIKVVPVSTDIQVSESALPAVFDWLPSAGALQLTTKAWHELVGIWYYRLRGWAEE
ncbi:MAG: YdcF family protein [bacterium]